MDFHSAVVANSRAEAWRVAETSWLTVGEVRQAALCRELVRYWERPWWRRWVTARHVSRLHAQIKAGSSAIVERYVEAVWR